MANGRTAVAIIGAGNLGIAAAHYLVKDHGLTGLALIDRDLPMGFTSAQSGENYRDWWPHPRMVRFIGRSIGLMEEIARATGNRIAMTRRGYALATRAEDITPALDAIRAAFEGRADLRIHDGPQAGGGAPVSAEWRDAPSGFDVYAHPAQIRARFPSLDRSLRHVIHVRRAGDISGQQLGQYMLETLRGAGVSPVRAEVRGIVPEAGGFRLELATGAGRETLHAARILNAAGPFAGEVAAMLGESLPLFNTVQQKIAFPDTARAIPRDLPFAIDLDGQEIDWNGEERALLREDPERARFAGAMPGGIHCRPDGGDAGQWIRLGWAYNTARAEVSREPPLDDAFPEIVLRGAARLNPALKAYYGRLPRALRHYGGFYTRTGDNWPLIGPMGPEGAFLLAGLSGHGTMAACAAGELAARWVAGAALPGDARAFSLERFAAGSGLGPERIEAGLL